MPIYRDIYDGPPRSHGGRTAKRWITIHCTQNTASAAAEASYAKRRTDSVSSHYYVDETAIVQSLDTDLRAHHVGSRIGNDGGIAYEITGLTNWSRKRWLSSVAWGKLGAAIARDCAAHGIPVRLCTVADLRAGRGGIMTHDQARQAWGGTTHTDPGPDFPLDHLIKIIKEGDDVSAEDVWRHRLPWANDWPVDRWGARKDGYLAQTYLSQGYALARRTDEGVREVLAGQAAILSRLDGADDGATRQAIRDELDRHRAALLAELADQLAEDLAERLTEVPPEVVRQAVRDALDGTRLVADGG